MCQKLSVLISVAVLAGAAWTSPVSTASSSPASGAGTSSPASSPSSVDYHPVIDPANFVSDIDNPFFPLVTGTTFVYRGIKDGQTQRDEVVVTHGTRVILGVTTRVVRDTATINGKLIEDTQDWYAQDNAGRVWYFGEDTKEFNDKGKVVSNEGSWEAGVDGAEPGIVMETDPQVPDAYRQEYWEGQAEDMAWVVDLDQPVKVPYGTFRHALLTLEFTRLEPNVIDKKYYVRNVGLVLEASAAGPLETAKLVSVTRP